MKTLRAILSMFVALVFAGCFQSAAGVKLKPDGSGTIDIVQSMSSEGLAQMNALGSLGGPDKKGKKPSPVDIDEPKLKAKAASLGKGVKFVSAKKLNAAGREGYVATYSFENIADVKLSFSDVTGGNTKPKTKTGGAAKSSPMTFQFTKGATSELVILQEKAKPDSTPKKPEPENPDDDKMLPLMIEMVKDMRVSVVLDVQGTILSTDATHRHGSRITLFDVEFGKLAADKTKLKTVMRLADSSEAEAQAYLKNTPGVMIEPKESVRVTFK
jgi:hypothetical protein